MTHLQRLHLVYIAMDKTYYIYILSSKPNGTLYIGVTSDLIKRVYQYKNKIIAGFTSKYNVNQLIYFEQGYGAEGAILREKELKKWQRSWKIALIETENPSWNDLYPQILGKEKNQCQS